MAKKDERTKQDLLLEIGQLKHQLKKVDSRLPEYQRWLREAEEKNELRSTEPPASSMLMTAHGSSVAFELALAARVTFTLLLDPVKLSKSAIR